VVKITNNVRKIKSVLKGGVKFMINLTWKVFSLTGNINSYLLFKEVERDGSLFDEKDNEFEFEELDPPAH
jgi:hypothetical protein